MLHRAGDSDRDVELGTHQSSRLSDLIAVRPPAVVGDGARGADRRISEGRGEVFDELEILRRLETASTGDDDRSFGEIELAAAALARLDHFHARGRGIDRRLRVFHASRFRILGRSDDVWTHRDDRGLGGDRDRRDDLPDVHRMTDDDRVAFDLERENVGDDADAETRCYTRREITPLRRVVLKIAAR